MAAEVLPLTTIGIIIIIAIALSILVKKLNLNPVLGFIIAGFLLGPFALGFLHPTDALVVGFGEIGLFILLFYLGLELSLKDFIAAGSAAFGLALIDMAALIGFSLLFSIIVGFMLFSTSTAIVAKFAIDKGIIKQFPVRLAISILILQDFLGILLLVFVTSLSTAGSTLGLALTALVFAVAAFFAVYQLSQAVEKWLVKNNFGHVEMSLYALGIGMVVATLGSVLGLSTALGAYFAGFALAETRAGRKIKSDINFLRDFFLVFFFVSFGTSIFFSKAANAIVLPSLETLAFFGMIAVALAIGIIAINGAVFSVFGPLFRLARKDAVLSALLLVPLGEFVVIIANSASSVLAGSESGYISVIGVLLIAITVIVFAPLYNSLNLYRRVLNMIPEIFKERKTKAAPKPHTPYTIAQLKLFALNSFVVACLAVMTMILYAALPRFGVPIIFSREVTAAIGFVLFAFVPGYKAIKAAGNVLRHAIKAH
ncbi:MAG: cation:proton antiporter [Candidatus Diapherotrites archaeon]|uniref:Cation:proton antiporter n=1 Tax=Candidatus Iainarchaeum sp. TaxID=3101447 RepID=A0A8T4KU21_9ARCH|nr:cation:proton antiporter [Candidatus Diapherotrites archaeon]